MIRLDGTIRQLAEAVATARLAYDRSVRELATVQAQRDALAAQVRASIAAPPRPRGERRPVPQPAQPQPAAPPRRPAGEGAYEASTRTVQNVLFALGGILLGVAAVVFTAVAWATFGLVGRAAILAAVTGLALAAPLLALRRKLVASAETFAALGLLLVVLDGYAAWYVDLFGLSTTAAPALYAAGVCAVAGAVSAGYGRLTGLTGPRYAAVVLVQPALPLSASALTDALAGHALAYTVVAVANLVAVRRAGGALRTLIWVFCHVALLGAAAFALTGQAVARSPAGVVQAGLSLTAAAAVFVAAAGTAGNRILREVAGATVALVLVEVASTSAMSAWPGQPLALVALAVAVVAALAPAVAPEAWRTGVRSGAGIAAVVVAAVVSVMALWAAVVAVDAAQPTWRADLTAQPSPFDWQLPAAVALLVVAALLLVPRLLRVVTAAVGAGFVALTIPSAVRHTWWLPSAVDLLWAAPLALLAVRWPARRPAAVLASVAAVLASHAVLTGLARPGATAWVLWSVVAIGTAMLVSHAGSRRSIVGLGVAAAILVMPAAADATVVASGLDRTWWGWAPLAAAVAGLGAAAAILRFAAPLVRPAALGVSGAAISGASYVLLRTDAPAGLPAGTALVLLGVLALLLSGVDRAAIGVPVLAGVVPGSRALIVIVSPVATLIVLPYTWLAAIWSGAPAEGPGLTPSGGPPIDAATAATLAVLMVAAAFAGAARGVALTGPSEDAGARARRGALAGVLVLAPLAGLAALVAAQMPWPGVPLVMLALGAAGAVVAARGWLRGRSAIVASGYAVALTGAGLAGLLPTEATTLGGLAAVVVLGAAVGALGRVVGWIVAVAAGCLLAVAAALAAELPLRTAAYGVLAVAAAALALGQWLRARPRRRPEAAAVRAAAQAAAGVAVLLAGPLVTPRHAAAVLTLWGIALGVCAAWSTAVAASRRRFAAAAAGCELVAWWLLLVANEVAVLEAYTLPAAALAAAGGVLALRRRPELHSWVAYGPALAAAFLPSLASALDPFGAPLRRLLVGVGAVVVVVAGAVRRRQAPVAVGGLVLLVLGLRELVAWWDLLPRWIPLAVAGLALVGLAMTYERRRRDLARLHEGFTRMT